MSLYEIESCEKNETPEEYWQRRGEYLARAQQTLSGEALTHQLLEAVHQGHYRLKADDILLLHADGFVNTDQALQLEELRQKTIAQESGRTAVCHFLEVQAA